MSITRYIAACTALAAAPALFILMAAMAPDEQERWRSYERGMTLYRECPDGAFLYEAQDGSRYAWKDGWVALPSGLAQRGWCPVLTEPAGNPGA
jgi:hypothetical protein